MIASQCPHCLLNVYADDPNTIVKGRRRWHAPCWFLRPQPANEATS